MKWRRTSSSVSATALIVLAVRLRPWARDSFAGAIGVAIPREERLLAAGRFEERVAVTAAGGLRRVDVVEPLGARREPQQRRAVAVQRAVDRAWKLGAQRGVDVPGERDLQHVEVVH